MTTHTMMSSRSHASFASAQKKVRVSDTPHYMLTPPDSSDDLPLQNNPPSRRSSASSLDLDADPEFDRIVTKFLNIKNQPFAVSGWSPVQNAQDLNIFFRSKKGSAHCVDFPIDYEHVQSHDFNTLLGICQDHTRLEELRAAASEASCSTPRSSRAFPLASRASRATLSQDVPSSSSYIFPPDLPLNSTLELTAYPILDTIRDVLFPHLPPGHSVTATRSRNHLEITTSSSQHGSPTPRIEEEPDDKVATLIVTLPVRFRGGALVVSHPDDAVGIDERFRGRGGKAGDLEWVAFLNDCNYGVEPVERGCLVSLRYDIRLMQGSGEGGSALVTPNARFLDAMVPLFTRSKGSDMHMGFFLGGCYDSVQPADDPALSIIPMLKGNDLMLFNAARLYGFNVELRYAAGGYVWTTAQSIHLESQDAPLSPLSSASPPIRGIPRIQQQQYSHSPVLKNSKRHTQFSLPTSSESDDSEYNAAAPNLASSAEEIRRLVRTSGAIKLAEAGIHALTAPSSRVQGSVTRLPVSFATGGSVSRLWVNVLMVIWEA